MSVDWDQFGKSSADDHQIGGGIDKDKTDATFSDRDSSGGAEWTWRGTGADDVDRGYICVVSSGKDDHGEASIDVKDKDKRGLSRPRDLFH